MRSPFREYLDRRDQKKARALQARLGPSGWLVSWHRVDGPEIRGEPWLARVSCPEWPRTVERHGSCRARAVHEALAALEAIVGPCDDLP